MLPIDLLKVILPMLAAFVIGVFITPSLTTLFYSYKLWKRLPRQDGATNPTIAEEFKKLHNSDDEIRTPRVGGSIIWIATILTVAVFMLVPELIHNGLAQKLNFFSRNQTLLPLFGLIAGALIGLFEDWLEIRPQTTEYSQGLNSKYLVSIVIAIGIISGWWFYSKLGIVDIKIPFGGGRLMLGWLIIPFSVLVTLGTFSSRVIDGIDGLAGGVMATIFGAFGFIAYTQNQIDIAALCAVLMGGILVFLWFNIPPARFYMGETGMLGLTVAISIIAFLTDSVLLLPIIGLPLVVTSLSSAIQITSKKYFHKKVFRVAPLHHHFESLGWSRPKITMRYWIISVMCAVAGIVISFFG